jgi:hypothetical protein
MFELKGKKMTKKLALVFGCVWACFVNCGTLRGNHLTYEMYETLGEKKLRKTQIFLSADIELTRSVSLDTQSAVTSGQAAIDQIGRGLRNAGIRAAP